MYVTTTVQLVRKIVSGDYIGAVLMRVSACMELYQQDNGVINSLQS